MAGWLRDFEHRGLITFDTRTQGWRIIRPQAPISDGCGVSGSWAG